MQVIARLLRTLLALVLMLALAGVGALWFGLVPPQYNPLAPLSLDSPPGTFLDLQLAALQRDPVHCQQALRPPHLDASPVPDEPLKDGCGVRNSVKFATVGGVALGVDKITCELAAAVDLWVETAVQPAALAMFGKRVTAIEDMGTFSCRNIIGSKLLTNRRSQHATANAIDIAGFTLEGGKKISVLKDWPGTGPEADFLHRVHHEGCRFFRVALSPNYNPEHKNHFHFDRGLGWVCR